MNINEIPMGSTDQTGNGSMAWGHPSCHTGKTAGQFLTDLDRPSKCSRSCRMGLSGETGPQSHPRMGQPKNLKGPDVTQQSTAILCAGKTQNSSKCPWKDGDGWQEQGAAGAGAAALQGCPGSDSLCSSGVRPGMDSAPASLRVIVSAFPHAHTVEMY